MTVARTLLQRRSLIGAWCFVDHYGPDRVLDVGGMDVAPQFPRVTIKPRFNVEPVARLDVRAWSASQSRAFQTLIGSGVSICRQVVSQGVPNRLREPSRYLRSTLIMLPTAPGATVLCV